MLDRVGLVAIANDVPGSLQMSSDMAALRRAERRLDADGILLQADTREGRMAAMSADSERVYNDRLSVNAQRGQIATDRAKVSADEKGLPQQF